WPGMNCEVSLTPMSRLTALMVTSPAKPASGSAAATTASATPSSGANSGPANQISAAVETQPPMKPSQVLLGLTLGVILRRPNSLPQTYCATSLNSVAASSRKTSPAGPAGPASAAGVRIRKAA